MRSFFPFILQSKNQATMFFSNSLNVQHEGNCSGAGDLMSKGHEGLHVGLIAGGGEVAEGRS